LVGNGDHDWAILFGQWGLLAQDERIGGATRAIGWIGMIAVMGWLAWRTYQSVQDEQAALLHPIDMDAGRKSIPSAPVKN
jgi:hypothetical protein